MIWISHQKYATLFLSWMPFTCVSFFLWFSLVLLNRVTFFYINSAWILPFVLLSIFEIILHCFALFCQFCSIFHYFALFCYIVFQFYYQSCMNLSTLLFVFLSISFIFFLWFFCLLANAPKFVFSIHMIIFWSNYFINF